MNKKPLFPTIDRSISDFLLEEEANISRKKILSVGTMLILVSLFLGTSVFAKHTSHSSHKSHVSHTSHSSGYGGHSSHESHQSHQSHTSHVSGVDHSSHSSAVHSNHASHSNSGYGHSSGNESIIEEIPSDIEDITRGEILIPPQPRIPPESPDMNIPNDITGG